MLRHLKLGVLVLVVLSASLAGNVALAQEEPQQQSTDCPADPVFQGCVGEELQADPLGPIPSAPQPTSMLHEVDEFVQTVGGGVVPSFCASRTCLMLESGDRVYHYCGVPVNGDGPVGQACHGEETHTYQTNYATPYNNGRYNSSAYTCSSASPDQPDWISNCASGAVGSYYRGSNNTRHWYDVVIYNQAGYYVREYGDAGY